MTKDDEIKLQNVLILQKKYGLKRNCQYLKSSLTSNQLKSWALIGATAMFLMLPNKFRFLRGALNAYMTVNSIKSVLNYINEKPNTTILVTKEND